MTGAGIEIGLGIEYNARMSNIATDRLVQFALETARAQLGEKRVERAEVREMTDASDERALNITFVLKPFRKNDLSGEKLSQISLDILDFLVAKGDTRFPYTHYITTEELKQLHAVQ